MSREIVQSRDPVLRRKAQDVPRADIASKKIRDIIADMKKLLAKEEYGVAIAAPQVGESLRIFVVSGKAVAKRAKSSVARKREDAEEEYENESGLVAIDHAYINPKVLKTSRGRTEKHEGCLSVRGKWGMVPRAEKITIQALDEEGKTFTRGASGFLAHIFQHELDHLDGILYIDKATEIYDDANNS